MKIDSYDKFKEYVESLNKRGFSGKFYTDDILENIFYWEYNSVIKFEIIHDWYFDMPHFAIGCDLIYERKELEEHFQIVEDNFIKFLERIENEGIIFIIKKNIFNKYSIVDIMFVNEYNDEIKNKYKDNFFNKYFEVFSKDK